jgi:hypothetical protein
MTTLLCAGPLLVRADVSVRIHGDFNSNSILYVAPRCMTARSTSLPAPTARTASSRTTSLRSAARPLAVSSWSPATTPGGPSTSWRATGHAVRCCSCPACCARSSPAPLCRALRRPRVLKRTYPWPPAPPIRIGDENCRSWFQTPTPRFKVGDAVVTSTIAPVARVCRVTHRDVAASSRSNETSHEISSANLRRRDEQP